MKKISMIVIVILVFVICIATYFNVKGKPVWVKTDKNVARLPKDISDIIYYASMAPNSHNTQLWKVFVDLDNNNIKISMDKERTLKEVDSTNREAYISIGAFTENLVKAFEAYGYEAKLEISDNDDELVSIIYRKINDNKIDNDTLDLIMKRHTDKSSFFNKNLNSDDVDRLLDGISNAVYFENGSESCDYLRKSAISAMEQQAYDKNKAEELSKWLRLSDEETIRNKDGLSAEQLGLTGIIKTFYYMSTTHESTTQDSYAKQAVDITKKQVENCSGFLIITGKTETKELIKTGMLLESIWLRAVKLGISVHPMSQVLEESPYCEEIDEKLRTEQPVQMVLRVGYVKDYGQNNRIRRDLADYVTVK